MKSAGIVTLYNSQNYGAFLQGFAMQTTLEKLGYEVEFVHFKEADIKDFLFMIKTKDIPLAFFRIRQYLKYQKEKKMLHISSSKSNTTYNAVVVGSDTLWDVQNPTIIPREEFLGRNLTTDRVIAYAPSANMTMAEEFSKVYPQENSFDSFFRIGVRDSRTQNLVREITGQSPQVVCDPTLLLDKSAYPVTKVSFHKKYILIYGYSFKPEEQVQIKKLAEKHGLVTVSIGLLNKWCDYNVTATVSGFLGHIEGAEFVCTSTFHGTIFATILQKKSVVFARENYKVLDIIAKLGIENRNVSGKLDTLIDVAEQEIDYDNVSHRIQDLREHSEAFLREALN